MRLSRVAAVVCSALLILPSPAAAFRIERLAATAGTAPAGAAGGSGGYNVIGEQVLVNFSTVATSVQRAAVLSMAGGLSMEAVSTPGWFLITLSSGASVAPALAALAGMPGVTQVAPNRAIPLAAYPSDPLVASQYALSNVGAFAAWDYDTGSKGPVTIAIIDTGIDGTHSDLSGKLVNSGAIQSQYFPVAGGQAANHPPTTSCNHGTQVASVAAASTNNGVGVAGASWGARLISLKVFDPGCATSSDLAISNAINYAANTLQNHAAIGKLVVNLSVGGPGGCNATGPLTNAALANLVTTRQVPVAISAGNNGVQQCTDGGNQGVMAPANCAGVSAGAGIIPVGATDSMNNVASFSCRGAELAAHGVSAPGVGVVVDSDGGGTTTNSGTSFSAPLVAGLMALMLSTNQTLTPAQIEAYLRAGAYSVGGQSFGPQGTAAGAGLVNMFNTMRLTTNGTLAGFDGESKPIAFPNPFKPSESGAVSFALPPSLQGTRIGIKIYTLDGIFVREVNGLSWNGKNTEGSAVASGTYVFVVTTSAGTGRGRLSVLR
ncbi:MAG: S8 family serine peptidase [Elusimicrobia bacterium]|nr:S8 family serine peptidase [Elusimicrobiota bacterium]